MILKKEEFNNFVEDVFRQEYMRIVNPKKFSEVELKGYLEKHLFFVTMTFNMAFNSNPRNAQRCMDSFRGMYIQLIKSLLGSHYSRKLPLQPLVFYCVDNQGSRHGFVNLVDGENLHIHALMLLHPQTMKVWSGLNLAELGGSDSTIDGLSFAQYDPARKPVLDLVSYANKAVRLSDQSICYDFLPKHIGAKVTGQENWGKKFRSLATNGDGQAQISRALTDCK